MLYLVSVRDAFFNKLYEKIKSGEDIYVLSSDLGAPSLEDLRKYYPERFINVGIAEQSLISISTGMVKAGKKVVAYGLNPFPMTRAFDQVRCLMGELNIPVVLCALNSGFCSAAAGYTHMATEVFGMARMLPNLKTYYPSDETISEVLAEKVSEFREPQYIVFDKIAGGKIYDENTLNFHKGYFVYNPTGQNKIAVVSTSSHTRILRKIVDDCAEKNLSVSAIDIFSVPFDEKSFIDEIKDYSEIITVEENVLQGGLGSYILEIISDNRLNISVKRFGVSSRDKIPKVFMDRDYLRKLYSLDEEGIICTLNDIYKNWGVRL